MSAWNIRFVFGIAIGWMWRSILTMTPRGEVTDALVLIGTTLGVVAVFFGVRQTMRGE